MTMKVDDFEPLLVSMREAARLLGIGNTRTFQLVKEGDLAHVKIGNRTLIPLAELKSFIAERLTYRVTDDVEDGAVDDPQS